MKNQPASKSMKNMDKRDEIVRHAYEVFYKNGFHATGVDSVLEDSGISKRTLYKYFPSKEALIEALVEHHHATLLAALPSEMDRRAADPVGKILSLFDIRREICEAGDYTGCFAINAKVEFEGKQAGIESACAGFYQAMERCVADLAREAGLADAQQLARQIIILFQGAMVSSQMNRDPQAFTLARETAARMLRK